MEQGREEIGGTRRRGGARIRRRTGIRTYWGRGRAEDHSVYFGQI